MNLITADCWLILWDTVARIIQHLTANFYNRLQPAGDVVGYTVVGYILETSPVCTVRVTMLERYAFQLYLLPAPKGLPRVYSNPDGTLRQGLPLKQNRSPRRSHPTRRTLLVLPLCQDFDLCGAQSEISRSIKLTRRRYGEFLTWLSLGSAVVDRLLVIGGVTWIAESNSCVYFAWARSFVIGEGIRIQKRYRWWIPNKPKRSVSLFWNDNWLIVNF